MLLEVNCITFAVLAAMGYWTLCAISNTFPDNILKQDNILSKLEYSLCLIVLLNIAGIYLGLNIGVHFANKGVKVVKL